MLIALQRCVFFQRSRYFSNATINWIKYGHAGKLASKGFRVIMPDLRAHGLSDKPHYPEAYPRGVLARDAHELIGGSRWTAPLEYRAGAGVCAHG